MIERNEIYVGGAWVPSAGDGFIEVVHSGTEEVMGRVPAGAAQDVDAAAHAAYVYAMDERGAMKRIPAGTLAESMETWDNRGNVLNR